jgi:hypothetical protein
MKKILLFAVAALFSAQFLNAQDYYWPLKADLKDTKGGLVGVNHGLQFKTDAVRGDVAYFDGNSYANLPSFIKGNAEISIAIWFKMDSIRPWTRIYSFGKGDQTEPKNLVTVIPVNGLPEAETTSGWYRVTATKDGPWLDADIDPELVKVEVGKWYYSTLVIKSDSIIGYFNDQVVLEEEFAKDAANMDDSNNALGKSFWADKFWCGALSDLRIYKKALTKADVVKLYNDTKGTGVEPPVTTGVKEVEKVAKVYATNKHIVVELVNATPNAVVSVYNVTGSLLQAGSVDFIRSQSFSTGIYVVKVSGANGTSVSKVVVE